MKTCAKIRVFFETAEEIFEYVPGQPALPANRGYLPKPAILLRSFAHPPVILLSNTFKSARVGDSTGESQDNHRWITGGWQEDATTLLHEKRPTGSRCILISLFRYSLPLLLQQGKFQFIQLHLVDF